MELLAGYYSPNSVFSTLPKEIIGYILSLTKSYDYFYALFNALGYEGEWEAYFADSFELLYSKQDYDEIKMYRIDSPRIDFLKIVCPMCSVKLELFPHQVNKNAYDIKLSV